VNLVAGPGYEDPAPFWDDDGTAWLIHSKVGAGPLFLRRMTADGKRVLDEGKLLVRDPQRLPTLEGPKLLKRDGWYYIWAPIGGVGTGPQAVGRSRSIDGPYEWRDVLVPSKAVEGPHQGGYVETPSGEGWFMHFDQEGAFGRIVYLEPVTWRDGWPVVGAAKPGATAGVPVTTHAAPATGAWTPEVQLQASDEFDAPELGLQWSWNHNPDNSAWSLARRPGFLRLEAPFADHLVTSRNTLTQILQGPRMTGTARIETGGMADGQRAGLSLFGVRPSWIGAVRERGRVRVTIANEGEEVAGPEVFDGRVDLRFEVTPDQKVRYSYSFDGTTFTPLGETYPLAPFSWWKGARPALFSFSRGTRHGYVDVDWFRVQVPGAAK
jgi:beta-xylosidase